MHLSIQNIGQATKSSSIWLVIVDLIVVTVIAGQVRGVASVSLPAACAVQYYIEPPEVRVETVAVP